MYASTAFVAKTLPLPCGRPQVAAAKEVKSAKFFGYGFDEAPKSCEKSIRTAFKAFLETYPPSTHPEVAGTMAALNWASSGGHDGPTGSHPSAGGMPMDMPYTGNATAGHSA